MSGGARQKKRSEGANPSHEQEKLEREGGNMNSPVEERGTQRRTKRNGNPKLTTQVLVRGGDHRRCSSLVVTCLPKKTGGS